MEKALSIGLQVDPIDAGSRQEIRIEEGFIQLAMLARDWCRLGLGEARQVIEGNAFAIAARKRIGDTDVTRELLEKAVSIAFDDGYLDSDGVAEREQHLIEPPRDLVGDPLAEPLVASFVDLLAAKAAADWPVEHDHMVLLNASVLLPERKQVTALWSGYLKAVESRLKHGRLSTIPLGSAPAILRQIGDRELPAPAGRAVASDVRTRAIAVFEASSGNARARWVLLFADRIVVGDVPKEELSLDDDEPRTYLKAEVRFNRLSRPLADVLVIHCGDAQRLIVEGSVAGTFAGYFGPVLESLGLDDALDIVENELRQRPTAPPLADGCGGDTRTSGPEVVTEQMLRVWTGAWRARCLFRSLESSTTSEACPNRAFATPFQHGGVPKCFLVSLPQHC